MLWFFASEKIRQLFPKNMISLAGLSVSTDYEFLFGYDPAGFRRDHDTIRGVSGARVTKTGAIFQGEINKLELSRVQEQFDNVRSPFSLGTFQFVTVRENGWNVDVDLCGQANIFCWQLGESYVLSNDVSLILQVLSAVGISARKSAENSCVALTYGTAFAGMTGYQDISLLMGTTFSGDGRGFESDGLEYLPELFGDYFVDYEAGVSEVHDFLIQAGESLREFRPDSKLLIDLTGGVDSRLTLAFILACFSPGEFEVFCSSSENHPDKRVFDRLVSGFALNPGNFYYAKPEVPLSYKEKLRLDVNLYSGTKFSEFGFFGGARVTGQIRVSGYYGEFGRLFHGFAECSNEELALKLVAPQKFDDVFRAKIKELAERKMLDVINGLDVYGFSFDDKLLSLYLLNRNKSHVGMAVSLTNKYREGFHPLCCPAFVKLARLLSPQDRRDNRLFFDLMKNLNPDLLAYPLAEQVWPKRFASSITESSGYVIPNYSVSRDQDPEGVRMDFKCKSINVASANGLKVNNPSPTEKAHIFKSKMRSLGANYHWLLLPEIVNCLNSYLDAEEAGSLPGLEYLDLGFLRDILERINWDSESINGVGLTNMQAKFLMKTLAYLVFLNSENVVDPIINEFRV